MAAAGSVALNNLLGQVSPDATAQDKAARENLITTFIAGVATIAGADAATATNAAAVEMENNGLTVPQYQRLITDIMKSCANNDYGCVGKKIVAAKQVADKQAGLAPEESKKLDEMSDQVLQSLLKLCTVDVSGPCADFAYVKASEARLMCNEASCFEEMRRSGELSVALNSRTGIQTLLTNLINDFAWLIGVRGPKAGAVLDGAGEMGGIPRTIPYQPSGTVVMQGGAPVCGPACAAMVVSDKSGASVSLEAAIGSFANGIRPSGVNANELSRVISNAGVRNSVETAMLPSQLDQALANGQTVIVNVGGHFIIVDSKETANGALYYMTRDPAVGPRGVLSSVLDSVMQHGANAVIIGK